MELNTGNTPSEVSLEVETREKARPQWYPALLKFDEDGFTYGSCIPHTWFYTVWNLGEPVTAEDQKRFQAAYTTLINGFKAYMLKERMMDISNTWGKGYRVIKPEAQTSTAMDDIQKGMSKVLNEGSKRLKFLNAEGLTDEQIRENRDAKAKVSQFRQMTTKRRWFE